MVLSRPALERPEEPGTDPLRRLRERRHRLGFLRTVAHFLSGVQVSENRYPTRELTHRYRLQVMALLQVTHDALAGRLG
jgi:hypothetical protein